MRNKIETLKAMAIGALIVPAFIGVIVMLTYVRKFTSAFWCDLFGF